MFNLYKIIFKRFVKRSTSKIILMASLSAGAAAFVINIDTLQNFLLSIGIIGTIEIDQITLNENESFFHKRKDISLTGNCCVEDPDLSTLNVSEKDLVQWEMTKVGIQLFDIYTELYHIANSNFKEYSKKKVFEEALQQQWPPKVKKVLEKLVNSNIHEVLGDTIFHGLLPVFDITLQNSTGKSVLLTEIIIEGQVFNSGGGSAAQGKLPAKPLQVKQRYNIDLSKMSSSNIQIFDNLKNNPYLWEKAVANLVEYYRKDLLPPIEIPREARARIQLQFFQSDDTAGVTWTDFVIRLNFLFDDASKVKSKYFVLSFPGSNLMDFE